MKARKILSVILAIALIAGTLSTVAFGADFAIIAGTGQTVENLDDAFKDAYNPDGKQVILADDFTGNVDIASGRGYSFYLNGHTINGTLKFSDGGVTSLYSALAGYTTSTEPSKIVNTGLDGAYPFYHASGINAHINSGVTIEATEENGVAIYCESGKVLFETSDDVTVIGDIKAASYGIINITQGHFTGKLIEEGNGYIGVTGGTFEIDPSANVLPGYEAKLDDATGLYTVVVDNTIDLNDLTPDAAGNHLISDANDVKIFRTLLSTSEGKNILSGEKFILTADVDMNGEVLPAAGSDSKRFMGIFDGQNHTISNVVIDAGDESYVAFFGNTSGATIQNLTLENITVKGGAYTAGLVGFTRNTVIDNCRVIGDIDIAGGSHVGAVHAGGVVSITDCEVSGNAGSTISGTLDVAGISGLISEGSTTVKGNSVSGVNIVASSGLVGGIIGRAIVGSAGLEVSDNEIENCAIENEGSGYKNFTGLVIGCTQAISGEALYEDNAVTNTTATEEGVAVDTLYVTKNYDGEDYGQNIASPVAKVNGVEYMTLADAFANVADGQTIELLRNVYLSDPVAFTKDMTITLDGKGYTISETDAFSNEHHTIFFGDGNDASVATKNYTIKNVVFDGLTTKYGLRLKGADVTVENCTFVNANQTEGFGLLSLTFCEADVLGCVFEDNACVSVIDINHNGDGCTKDVVIDKCVFDNNTCSAAGVIIYSDGNAVTVNECEFVDNTVSTTENAAIVYMGFNTNIVVTDNAFKNNEVSTTSTSTRVAGAVFAGPIDNTNEISGNVFIGNTVSNANGSANLAKSVLVQPYAFYGNPDDVSVNLGENYWEDGSAPEEGSDYKYSFYSGAYQFALDSYYEELDSDGNPTNLVYDLENPADTAKKVIVKQIMNGTEPTDKFEVYLEGEYNGAPAFINKLVATEIDFEVTGDFTITDFKVADAKWTSEVTANGSYLIREKGAEDAQADLTDKVIFLGTLTLEGYGAGTIEAACHYGAVQQRTENNNIVVSSIAAPYSLDFNIYVPRKDLEITIDFNNAVEKQVADYQDMTVVVTGGDLENEIEIELGNEAQNVALTLASKPGAKYIVDESVENKYTITLEDALTIDTTYTVTVKGAGYRTIRKNVTMTEDKTVNFWNNVKDLEGADYLAGDIVKDNVINIYDLSAVVSYFGTINDVDEESTYAKYDLNRDGKVDSKDVAYVLVSWGK